ncbi:fluoride efflux transporter FluC [Halomarina ordinaria]|uniref:Fluoride-specific ion channel FluC n=1 Tax=Halomarina ordinaria TaxID=3033939 RepID=A0ABD5UEQ9_9EURY|nr:CrcB family protein [Halomarina sp. PSRA2]
MSAPHPLSKLESLALVAVGGFVGANARYLVGVFVPDAPGTLVVNVLGSIALGFLLTEATHSGYLAAETRVVLGSGFLSSFTTYSTFAVETALLGSPVWMLANVTLSYALGFAGAVVGAHAARALDAGRGENHGRSV